MDVVLDTNIYTALLFRQGRNIFSSNAFVELFTYLRRTKSNLIVPGPVFHEIIKEYSDMISASIKNMEDSWTTLQRNAMSRLIDCGPSDLDKEVETFREQLLNPGVGFEVIILEDYKGIALAEVVRRGVHRVRPSNEKGEELRDVVIWLVALEHAKTKNSKLAFITDDGHFKGSDGNFHPDLLRDLATHKVEILYYDSIPRFITSNALELSVVLPDEIAQLVKEGLVESLLIDRFKAAKFEDVTVSGIQFEGAQKYKVADDSHYVEAKYMAVVRYSEIEPPLDSVYFSGAQGGMFSGIGQKVPLSSLAGTPFRKRYEAVVNLVLSFRTVADTAQSVEVLQIEIPESIQLSQVPVVPPEGFFIS
jgi:hypothetical protein